MAEATDERISDVLDKKPLSRVWGRTKGRSTYRNLGHLKVG